MRGLGLVALGAAISLAALPASAAVTYKYTTWTDNPLISYTGPPPELLISIELTMDSAFVANSIYAFSYTPSALHTGGWRATTSESDLTTFGTGADYDVLPGGTALPTGLLLACHDDGCFGGYIVTGDGGRIEQWNLVANSPLSGPSLSFISYKTAELGAVDAIGGVSVFYLNDQRKGVGGWTLDGLLISDPPGSRPPPVPEPSTWALLLVGFGLAGVALRGRHRPLAMIRPTEGPNGPPG